MCICRSQPSCILSQLSILRFEIVSLTGTCGSLVPLDWMVRDLVAFASLALELQVYVITVDFCVGSEDQIQVPMLLQQALW